MSHPELAEAAVGLKGLMCDESRIEPESADAYCLVTALRAMRAVLPLQSALEEAEVLLGLHANGQQLNDVSGTLERVRAAIAKAGDL